MRHLDHYLTTEPPSLDDRATAFIAEQEREEKWRQFEHDCLVFANSEPSGFAAVLRAVANANEASRKAQGDA